MNSTSESLLSAVDILVENALSKLSYDQTVKATIYSVENLDEGEYKVKYSGNIVSAYAEDTSVSYEVDDVVYVLIPEGDMSNKKLIRCKVDSSSLSYGEMISLTNSFNETSPNFDTLYNDDWSGEVGVVAGAPPESELSHATIFEADENTYHDYFRQYSAQNELIRIKASFKTNFHCTHNQGNYGIIVEFYTTGDELVYYQLDLSSFNGAPYSFSVYSPQYVVITATAGFLTGVKSIYLFEEDFEYDRYVVNGEVTENENQTNPNIWCKDVEICFVEKVDLTSNLYYVDISTPKGTLLTKDIPSIDLVARLVYQGESILSSSTCEVKWFVRDLSIMVGNDYYDSDAGITWRPIDSTSFSTLTLTTEDVIYQTEYKLVVIYNGEVVMTDTETVYNLLSDYDFYMEQVTTEEDIELTIVNNANDEVLLGNWYLSNPDGSYSFITESQNTLVVTEYLLYSAVTFYCEVVVDGEVIGNLQHTITRSTSSEDVTISYIGEDSFRYDANGDVTIEDSEKERTLQVTLTWADGVGSAYTVTWLTSSGEIISNTQIDPEDSMIQNLWVDAYNILHYTIRQKYKITYNNNSIIVRITTVDNKVYDFEKEIIFVKDGDQGTSGTTYIIAIRPCDSNGVKLSGLNPLIYRNGAWVNNLLLRCYVYKDGESINSNSSYKKTYTWNAYNVSYGIEGEYITVRGEDVIITDNAPPYVKIQVTINDEMNDRTYRVYAFYPLDVSVEFTDDEINIIDIDDIPSYIKYTSSGTDALYYTNNISFLYGDEDYSANITSLTTDILEISTANGLYYLKPASSFIFENNSMAMIKCTYSDSKYLLHPIIMYLDTYGNEAINGWDGSSLLVNDDGENSYVFAPQVGAGEKDSYNRFSGVVMGKDSGQDLIGLYGYQEGINTFGLMEDGRAFFGASSGGGRIWIDGNSATIEGGGGGDDENGMTITLANLDKHGTAIKLGAGVFRVDYDGFLYASNVEVTGIIQAETGYIGGSNGWIIEEYRIYSGKSSTRVELNSNPSEEYAIWCGATSGSTAAGSTFAVTKDGNLYAYTGIIGGWTMTSTYLESEKGNIGMRNNGTKAAFWAGSSLTRNSTSMSTTSSSSTGFLVTYEGKLYCNEGQIGGWALDRTELSGGYTVLDSSDGITTNKITIKDESKHELGTLGELTGNDGVSSTTAIGINGDDYSIILRTDVNIGLEADGGVYITGGSSRGVTINGGQLVVTVAAANQKGIYARFA